VRRLLTLVAVAAIVGTTLVTGIAPASAAASRPLKLVAASTGAKYVTGGDLLVKVRNAAGPPKFSVAGHGTDAQPMGERAWLVKDLPLGGSRITVKSGDRTASLAVVNHPISGPVFSGPHLPILCTVPQVATRATEDATCDQETTTEQLYRTKAGTFAPMPADGGMPADGVTTTVGQRTVPYVVRVEHGTINRSPYSFAVLQDPKGWNRRLVYQFGGGCGTAYSQGGALGTNVVDESLLSKGYAVATANLNTFQTSCNDVLSAETTMMVKEHVAETIGKPKFTIGAGASGGAIQQLMIGQNYPGLLDALSPVIPFPDAISTAPGVSDCGLLKHFYDTAGSGFTEEQQIAVNGHRTTGTCALWISSFLGTIDPTTGCDPQIPAAQIFTSDNTDGIRCTLQDLNRNEFGIDSRTGYARRPLDNVGVQYGLKAVNAGTISVDQFLDLNEKIGGYDIDGQIVDRRERSRAADNRHAYETGRVLSGGALRDMPIITVNLYSDAYGDIHDRFRLFSIRERLKQHGKVDRNEVIWTRPSTGDIAAALTGGAFDPTDAVQLLDRWLTNGYRPKEAVDNCTDATGEIVSGNDIYTKPGPCRDLYPVFGDSRTAAGAPLANDILKCRRQPVDVTRYRVKLTSDQEARLKKIFPTGVCNWEVKGVGQAPLAATWIDYGRPRYGVTKAEAAQASSG
jgi:Tannase-like family of unknown function (DUF6351)